MKRTLLLFTALVTIATLPACDWAASVSPQKPAASAQTEPPSTFSSENESSARESDAAVKSALFDQAEIETQFLQVIDACADVVNGFVIDHKISAYPMPTLEEYTRMQNAIGALGFPVDYYDLDMPNYEKVETFWREVQEEKDTQIVIYCLYNWGIVADILKHHNGENYYTTAVYNFPTAEDTQRQIGFGEPVYRPDTFRMTEKGYLLYHISTQDGGGIDRGYRVRPLGEELRGLCRNYVNGLGYMPGGLLRENWSKDDFSKLNMDMVFESLYYQAYEDFPQTAYPAIDTENRTLISMDTMEKIMLGSLPLSKEQLREMISFDEVSMQYAYRPFAGGGFAPTPEVVEAVYNADGSLSLTVDAVATEFGDDQSMRGVLTVADRPDGGIRYISNTLLEPFS